MLEADIDGNLDLKIRVRAARLRHGKTNTILSRSEAFLKDKLILIPAIGHELPMNLLSYYIKMM